MAGRNACSFAGRSKPSAKHCKDAQFVLFRVMRIAGRLMGHVADMHGDNTQEVQVFREHLGIFIWCLLANFLICVSNGTGLWDKRWAEPMQQEVEDMLLCSPSLDILPWDSRPGKLSSLSALRPPVAAKPSDLSKLCVLKGIPLVKACITSDSDKNFVNVVEGPYSLLDLSELDRIFKDGLDKCLRDHLRAPASDSSPTGTPQLMQHESLQGLSAAGADAEDEDFEDEGQGLEPLEELERERRAARTVCRFCRLCLVRWVARRAAEGTRRLGLTAPEPEAGQVEGLAGGVTDPFHRRLRYSIFEERALQVGNSIRFGLWNIDWQSLLLDDSYPGYQQILRGLRRFSAVYAARICGTLIRADLAYLELSRLANTVRSPYTNPTIYSTLSVLASTVNAVEASLLAVDQQLLWESAADLADRGQPPPVDIDFATPAYHLDVYHTPYAMQLIGALLQWPSQPVIDIEHQPARWSWAAAANQEATASVVWPKANDNKPSSFTTGAAVENLGAAAFGPAGWPLLSSEHPPLQNLELPVSTCSLGHQLGASTFDERTTPQSAVGSCPREGGDAACSKVPEEYEGEGGGQTADLSWGKPVGMGPDGDRQLNAATDQGESSELGWTEASSGAKKVATKRRFGRTVSANDAGTCLIIIMIKQRYKDVISEVLVVLMGGGELDCLVS
jgi:hypothetical protein